MLQNNALETVLTVILALSGIAGGTERSLEISHVYVGLMPFLRPHKHCQTSEHMKLTKSMVGWFVLNGAFNTISVISRL